MSDVTGGTNPGVVLTGSEQRVRHFQRDREIMHGDELSRDLRALLRDLDEARAALVSVQRESDQESARAGKCADDLARVTQERDEARTNIDWWRTRAQYIDHDRDALAAKLASAEGLLQRALAAFKAKGVVRGVDEWCDECYAYFAASEQEPRT